MGEEEFLRPLFYSAFIIHNSSFHYYAFKKTQGGYFQEIRPQGRRHGVAGSSGCPHHAANQRTFRPPEETSRRQTLAAWTSPARRRPPKTSSVSQKEKRGAVDGAHEENRSLE